MNLSNYVLMPEYSNSFSVSSDSRVIVVGAGLTGLSAAIELAEAGVPVLVVEKGDVGGEQSQFALGWVRTTGRPPVEIPLSLLNRSRFDALMPDASRLAYGVLFCAKDETQLTRLEQWADGAARYGVKTRLLDAADTAARLPGCATGTVGGLLTEVDTSIDPRHLVQVLVARAAALGVEIRTRCAVRALDMAAGEVRGVLTERGIERGASVVLATGAWTRLMLRDAGYTLPSVKVRSSLVRIRTAAHLPPGCIGCAGVAGVGYRAAPDGTFVVGLENNNRLEVTPDALRFASRYLPMWWAHRGEIKPSFGRAFFDELGVGRARHQDQTSVYEQKRILRPEPGQALTQLTISRFAELFPSLGDIELLESWAGYLDMTPDGLPVISAAERTPGLFVATGLNGSGLGTGLAAGRLIASLVTGRMPETDISPFRLARWSRDGPHGVDDPEKHAAQSTQSTTGFPDVEGLSDPTPAQPRTEKLRQ